MARIIKEGKHVYWLDGEGLKVPVESTKQYLIFRRRDETGKMQTITLNYSAL